MPLNNSYDEQAVIQAIASALETFYGTLIEKIDGLNIQKVMKRKNPYLYRAKAMQSATEIVDSVLTAFVSSSEETIFGNCFFEPIAIAASGGNKALAEGIDIMIQNNETNTISAIAVKSGPSVFNADSKKRQEQNFTAASKLAQQAKARYEAYIGYCYGKKKESGRGKPKMYQELAGKRFWTELTGDEDFYIKIIGYMGTMPEKYVADYKESYNRAANRLINVSNPVSVLEWEKQMAVRAVRPKDQRNEEGVVDNSKQKDTIEITAYFDGAETAEAYFGLSSYLQYTRKELAKCCEIVEKAQKREGAVGYEFPWREVDESQIEVNGFEKKKLQFTIAQDNILQLLVGHTLYNDSSVVVRELVQNGIDAVRLQTEYEKRNGKDYSQGKVWVEWNSVKRQLSFWDNGTGMSIQDVENYLLKVGASKYRDEVVKKQFPNFTSISHFGIGILTCFMVANDIDIVTSSDEQEEANSINLRKVNGSYLLRKMDKNELDVRIKQHGTMVKLYVRSDVDMAKLENDLRKWIVVPEIPVYLSVDGNENIRIGYNSLKEILIKYLNETGHDVDGEKYDVYEKKHGNVTVAYAVRHLKYMSDWCLMSADRCRV